MGKKALFFVLVLFMAGVFLQGCVIAPARQYGSYTPVTEEEYEDIAYDQDYYDNPPVEVAFVPRSYRYMYNGIHTDVWVYDEFGVVHVIPWYRNGSRVVHYEAKNWYRANRAQRKSTIAEKKQRSHVREQIKPTHTNKPAHEKPAQAQTPKAPPKVQPAAKSAPAKKPEKKKKNKDDKE